MVNDHIRNVPESSIRIKISIVVIPARQRFDGSFRVKVSVSVCPAENCVAASGSGSCLISSEVVQIATALKSAGFGITTPKCPMSFITLGTTSSEPVFR